MNDRLRHLAIRVHDELGNLDRAVGRVKEGCQRAQRSSDDYYLDGVALNLHGFYAGLERIFELIAVAGVQGARRLPRLRAGGVPSRRVRPPRSRASWLLDIVGMGLQSYIHVKGFGGSVRKFTVDSGAT